MREAERCRPLAREQITGIGPAAAATSEFTSLSFDTKTLRMCAGPAVKELVLDDLHAHRHPASQARVL
jgi:hypothetical protein